MPKKNMNSSLLKKISTIIKLRISVVLTFLFLLMSPFISRSTHISGADITYKWLSGNTYQLNVTLYRDCAGIAAPSTVGVNYSSVSCSFSGSFNLSRVAGTGQEISHVCSSAVTTCSSGTLPGIQKYDYVGTVTLPMVCTDWIFGYAVCCRNCAITTLSYSPTNCSGVPGTYVEATLNNRAAPTNSAPVFTNIPVAFFCVGQAFHYNHGAFDADGDSLVYSFVTPRSQAGTNVVFKPGYSASSPLSSSPAITLDNSGDITITPTQLEVGVMTILVKEYRNGVLIGSVVRDMEVYTQNCSNSLPTSSGINGSGNFDLVTCPGKLLTFRISSGDPNSTQTVTMTCINNISGSTFVASPSQFPSGTFNWTPTIAQARPQPYTFLIIVQDNNCPFLGFQTYSFTILVPPLSTTIATTNSNCAIPGSGTASVTAVGSAPFSYSWTPGGSTNSTANNLVGGNYSCVVTDKYGCTLSASTSIFSPSILSLTSTMQNNVSCKGRSDGIINLTANGGVSPFTYSWSPNVSSNANATNLSSGNYRCTVTDANGCTRSMTSTITQPPTLNSTMSPPVNLNCNGINIGAASVVASGGTSPYQYNWLPGNSTLANVTNLSAGNYQVIVSDSKGCTTSSSVVVTEPAPIVLSAITQSTFCGASNGTLDVNVSGGKGPYSYLWSPGNISMKQVTGVAPGNYSVQVTDANGCLSNVSTSVNAIPNPTLSLNTITDVTCFNGNNGSASVNIFNGTAPFTYQWLPSGGNTSSANQLSSGNYRVNVTDANGCTSSVSLSISQPPVLIATTSSIIATCGNNNGSASVVATGGISPYNYSWSNGSVGNPTIANLSAGTYSVVVTDYAGCTSSSSLSISNTGILIPSIASSTTPNCFGSNDATATVTIIGGTAPYSYSWSQNPSTYSTAVGLSNGTYTVTVTDANGCSSATSILISEPPELLASSIASTPVTCYGGSNGRAEVNSSGGVPPYTYSWVGYPNGTSFLNNRTAGTYLVTVTDSHGCTVNSIAIINEPSQLVLSSSSTASTCGNSNGAASVSVVGGLSPYNYLWPQSGTTGTQINNLNAGSYTVNITDNNGCTISSSIGVSNINGPTASMSSLTSVNCYGNNDGSAIVAVSGGTPPFNYSWSCSTQNIDSISGIPVGTHSVVVTDGNGCVTTVPFNIPQPSRLFSSATSSAITCYADNNGQATISVNGGVAPYSYLWSNGLTTSSISNLSVGNYSAIVTDSKGCTSTASATISQPTILTASTVVNNVRCFNQTSGSAIVSATGGSSIYTYQWSNGQTGQMATGLSAGNYQVVATDSRGCSTTSSFVVSQPTQVQTSISSFPTSCGNSNGVVSALASGGISPYNYNWTPGNISSTQIAGLNSGNYFVEVSDANGCSITSSTTISSIAPPSATISSVSNISCYGGNDGRASVTVANGTAPFNYSWSPQGGNSASASGLSSGMYTVLITDANGCSSTTSTYISQPSNMVVVPSSTSGICGNSTGTAIVQVSGGRAPYSYTWSSGETGINYIDSLPEGLFSVVVSDNNGCSQTKSIVVRNTGVMSLTNGATNAPNCFGGNDANATVSVSGGTAPYTYSWSPNVSSSNSAIGLSMGRYDVTITDANACVSTIAVLINEPPELLVSAAAGASVTCYGNSDGRAEVEVIGGVPPYSFAWQGHSDTTSYITNTTAGYYEVTVTDSHGCTVIGNSTVTEPQLISLSPSTSLTTCGSSNGAISISVNGGQQPYSFYWPQLGITNSQVDNLIAGSYSIIVTDNAGCTSSMSVGVSNIVGPSATISSLMPVNCNAGSDGGASVSLTEGTAPFNFQWSCSNQNTNSVSGIPAGSYSVMITDSNQCVTTLPFTITSPTVLSSSITTTPITCFGGGDGQLSLNPSGGTSPYTYNWSDGTTSSDISNSHGGTYSAIITDANGCTISMSGTINQPQPVLVSTNVSDALCFNEGNGSAIVSAVGGAGSYSFQWSDGQSGQMATNLSAGNYSVIGTDVNGCTSSHYFTVSEPQEINVTANITPTSCVGNSTGNISLSVQGGVRPFNFSWSPSTINDSIISNLSAGNYLVVITDSHGCSYSSNFNVDSPIQMSAVGTMVPAVCYNSSTGIAKVQISGGASPYSYSWSSGSVDSVATGLQAGNYFVVATDQNGCTITKQIQVTEPSQVTVSMMDPPIICIGQTTSVTANAQGGSPGYTYYWSNTSISQTQTFNPTSTTNYSVYVIDANGCQSLVAPVRVMVNPPLLATSISSDTICKGAGATMIANASGGNGGPYNYSWSDGNNGNNIYVAPFATTNYLVTVTDQCGTPPVQQQVTINVLPIPNAEFSLSPYSGCPGLSVDFTSQQNTISISSHYWEFGDGGNDTSANPTHTYSLSGIYSVNHTVTSDHGCKAEWRQPASVQIKDAPVANFSVSTEDPTIVNPNVVFTDLSIDPSFWNWSFGDGDTSVLKNPEHMYRDTGLYLVRLLIRNNNMCWDTIHKFVKVKGEFIVYFPNTFTPNEDGINERFKPLGIGIYGFKMLIFDRWGEIIYTSNDENLGWDGTLLNTGKHCQEDTYVYLSVITDEKGEKHEYKGRINLLK